MRREVASVARQILQNEPYSRENDGYLIRRVVETLEPNLYKKNFMEIMDNLQYHGISCESITKEKQNFLDTYPELYGNNEVWKDIKGFEGIYQVSNYGRIKSIVKYNKLMKSALDKSGYLKICLTDFKHKKHTFKVHRLVAENFLENEIGKEQVNHIDGNKKNNKVENLEWCTQSENMQHAFKNNLIFRGKGKESHRAKAVNQYSLDGRFIRRWDCIAEARKELKFKSDNITSCCKGNRKTSNGYKWKYEQHPELKIKRVEEIRREKEQEYYEEYSRHIPRTD